MNDADQRPAVVGQVERSRASASRVQRRVRRLVNGELIVTVPIDTMRQEFEDWAQHAAGLDTAVCHSESPLDRPQYERSDTALAWNAWLAAGYGSRRYPLTEAQVEDCIDAANRKFNARVLLSAIGQQVSTYDDWKHWLAREIERAHHIEYDA